MSYYRKGRLGHIYSTFVLVIFILMMFSSCHNKYVYSYYKELDADEWKSGTEYFYSFPIENTTQDYSIFVDIRYTPKYAYKNLNIGVVLESPDRVFQTFQYGVQLDMKENGFSPNAYHYFTKSIKIQSATKFDKKGLYTLSISHLMNDSVLNGIAEIGIRVTENR